LRSESFQFVLQYKNRNMEEKTYTREEVIELLSCYESHIRCHISQYIDKADLMCAEEWAEHNMIDSKQTEN
jgi:hypothetical protein